MFYKSKTSLKCFLVSSMLMTMLLLSSCGYQRGQYPVSYDIETEDVQNIHDALANLKIRNPSYRVFRCDNELKDDSVSDDCWQYYRFNVKNGSDSIMFMVKVGKKNSILLDHIGRYTDNWFDFFRPNSTDLTSEEKKHYLELFETQVLDSLDLQWSASSLENFINGLF